MGQLVNDAKELVIRLKEREKNVDQVVIQSNALSKKVDSIQQLENELMGINEKASHRSKVAVLSSIQKENKVIKLLQQENEELKESLEEHQSVLEIIMSKYRQQMLQLIRLKKQQELSETYYQSVLFKNLQEKTDQIAEMTEVMKHAIEIDDKTVNINEERLQSLLVENRGLKDMLKIRSKYGLAESPNTMAKEVQTDDTNEILLKTTQSISTETIENPTQSISTETIENPTQSISTETINNPTQSTSTETINNPTQSTSTETINNPTQSTSTETINNPTQSTSTATIDVPTQSISTDTIDIPNLIGQEKSLTNAATCTNDVELDTKSLSDHEKEIENDEKYESNKSEEVNQTNDSVTTEEKENYQLSEGQETTEPVDTDEISIETDDPKTVIPIEEVQVPENNVSNVNQDLMEEKENIPEIDMLKDEGISSMEPIDALTIETKVKKPLETQEIDYQTDIHIEKSPKKQIEVNDTEKLE